MIVSRRRVARALPRCRQAGVGLIEVLVAVLLLSIAFLGIAALQGRSLSTNNSAMARSLATIASYSILDAMRADLGNARAGSYNRTGSSKITANACPDASGSMAEAQLGQWCAQLGQGLGAVETTSGQVACTDVGATADCTVTITFDDSRAGVGGSSVQTVATRAML
ncbi:type IV pilus modification protein PilV [Rhodanobacter sp. DHB23]|uniref:type IV pilus modification protein PilV n=1 Tax=Rhodanobacter sp. DHB23 TaxID=2775923 RepID=UPI00177F3665|nr:type IV pilus modification protein PilV [Rhodanobacter sp. DHB23]MBD8871990.1 type IV pilus modification protein PilV [Rhodanobacter sp. DHB23]